MPGHLSEEQLIETLEGLEDAQSREHLRECGSCATRVREAGQTLRLVSDVGVPEPSPLYWEALRQQIGRRLEAERPRIGWTRFWIPGLATAVVASLAVASFVPRSPMATPTPAKALPAWSALPEEDDAALSILQGLGPSEEEVESLGGGQGVADRLAGLSDDESRSLGEALRGEWQGRKI